MMRGTKIHEKTLFSRILVFAVSIFMTVAFIPYEILETFASEPDNAAAEEISDISAPSDELKYQTISTSPENDKNEIITLNGLMPSDAEISVHSSEDYSKDNLCAYDISITDTSGSEFQPETDSPIKVRIKNPAIGAAASQEQSLRLWHIDDNGIREEIKNFRIVKDTIIFDAAGFSVYEVDDGSPPLRTYYFQMPEDPVDNTEYNDYFFPTSSPDDTSYKMICQQTIKNGEKPIFPQLPAHTLRSYTFVGWFVYDENNNTLSEEAFDFKNIASVTQNEDVILRAVFRPCVYAIFYDQYNGKSGKFPVMATRRGELAPSSDFGNINDIYGYQTDFLTKISIRDLLINYDKDDESSSEMIFKGWAVIPEQSSNYPQHGQNDTSLLPEVIKEKIDNGSLEIINDKDIYISETTRFYPIFEPICWIMFNTNQDSDSENPNTYQGATYKPPLYFENDMGFSFTDPVQSYDETPAPPEPPVLNGYKFDGWFTGDGVQVTDSELSFVVPQNAVPDANGIIHLTDSFGINSENRLVLIDIEGQQKLSQINLYAHWSPAASKYTVIIWKQKATDVPDLEPEEKDWDFERSIVISNNVKTNDVVSVAQEYKNYGGNKITINESSNERTYDFTGFSYDTDRNALEPAQVTVRGDGKTVLNVYYKRNKHTLTFQTTPVPKTITALYGADILENFPIDNNANVIWHDTGNPKYYTEPLINIETMPDKDVTFRTEQRNATAVIYYYVEIDADDAGEYKTTRSFDNSLFGLYKTVDHGFHYLTYNEEYHPIKGYIQNGSWADPAFNGTRAEIPSSSHTNYLYYKRESYIAEFTDSFTNDKIADNTILFRQKLINFLPDMTNSPEGYEFSGWYADEACTVPVAFTDDDYEKFSLKKEQLEAEGIYYQFQDYRRMPANNIRVYAGWSTKWFRIEIDPNGGQLSDTQATWFWEPWNGDPIEEYKTVSRNFEPDVNGEYYYALRDRKYYGLGDEWDPAEDTLYSTRIENGYCTRGAFYTTDISLATSAQRYREATNAYKYIGWYKVDPVTGKEEPYNFGTIVQHDTYLRLHWKQLGFFYIEYNAGEGTIDKTNENEVAFAFLDADDYTDHADIVITRVANAPEGKNFIGWKIRNDSSGKVYYPSQSFIFNSNYAVSSSEIVNGQIETTRTIYLDAVYEEISNAAIIYDPNGGEVDETAMSPENAGGQNYELTTLKLHSEHPLITEYSISDNKLIVSDIMNNSAVKLSNGAGFAKSGYDFIGWSTTPNSENGIFFSPGSICYADNIEPIVLYAQWAVRVYFDRNNENVPANDTGWSGEWSDEPYPGLTYDADRKQYYTVINLGSHVNKPAYDLVSENDEEMFKYWSQTKQSLIGVLEQPFDFSEAVTEDMINSQGMTYTDGTGTEKKCFVLFGCWAAPIRIPVHIVDTTKKTWVKRDDWLKDDVTHIVIRNTVIPFEDKQDAEEYADSAKVTGMDFAFACKAGNDDDGYLDISEDTLIKSIWYDTEDMKVKVRYSDGSVHNFSTSAASPDAVYLVYYKSPENIPINYITMSVEGALEDVPETGSHLNNAPHTANVTASIYDMQANITQPLYWAKSNSFTPEYYSYATGSTDAENVSDLRVITNFSISDTDRPSLQIRNKWNGFSYSLDGSTWNNSGYDMQLYVIYYETRPTIVDLTEKTIGMPEDMSEEFEYTVNITQSETKKITKTFGYYRNNRWYSLDTGNYQTQYLYPEDITTVSSQTKYTLSNDNIQSFVLFYSKPADPPPGKITKHIINGVTQTYTYKGTKYDVYYIDTISDIVINQTIEIVQTPKQDYSTANDSPKDNDVYIASYTSSSVSDPVTITYTNTHQLKTQIHLAISSGNTMTQNDPLRISDDSVYEYTFSAEGDTWDISGIDTGTFITDTSGRYVFSEAVSGEEDSDGNITIKNSDINCLTFGDIGNDTYGYYLNGDNTKLLADNNIYLVYVERPVIQYMFENPKTGELMQISPLEKNGTAFTRDGASISQNEMVPVTTNGELLISQISTPGNPAFLIPDMLDNSGKYSSLDLAETAVRKADGSLDRSNSETIYINCSDGKLNYHFTKSDTARTFTDDLIVYAIYKVKGYTLRLTKTIKGDASGEPSDYTFTVHSDDMPDGEYYISGYGDADTVNCTDHNITLTVQNRSDVTIYGLPQGDYTLTESAEGHFYMTVNINNTDTVVSQNTAAFHIDRNTEVSVLNVYPIPVTGADESANPYITVIAVLVTAAVLLIFRRKEEIGNDRTTPLNAESEKNVPGINLLETIKSKQQNFKLITKGLRFMKKILMKKAFAVVTAFMTASTMAVSLNAFAADTKVLNVPPAHVIDTPGSTAIISVKKDIVPFNPDKYKVHEPNIVYTYDITPANSDGAKIKTKDSDNKSTDIDVHDGILNAIRSITDEGDNDSSMSSDTGKKTGTITFGKNNAATAKKTSNNLDDSSYNVDINHKFTKQMNITINADYIYNNNGDTDGGQDNPPGVYRYKITDVTAGETFTQAGVTDGRAGNDLFLDVYTKYNNDQTGYVIYGYVLFRSESSDSTTIEYTEETIDKEIKTEGYTTSSEGDNDGNGTLYDLNEATFDRYITYNAEVKKEVSGSLADKQHMFPFTVTLSNETVKSAADFTLEGNNISTTELALDASGAYSNDTIKLKHGDAVRIIGLPAGTSIMVTEKNDTNDEYTVSMAINSSPTTVKKGEQTGNSFAAKKNEEVSLSAARLLNNDSSTDLITVTNTLTDVSITGLIFSIVPYIFITLAGIVLLLLVIKNKKNSKNNNMI